MGGMGVVWSAYDPELDRQVAIKVLPAAVARDPASRDRMVREARAQALKSRQPAKKKPPAPLAPLR